MGVHEAIDVLVADWAEIRAGAGPADRDRMDELARAVTGEPIPAVATRRATELVRLVSRLLPREHRLRVALAARSVRLGSVQRDLAALDDWLRTREALRGRTSPAPAPPTMAAVHAEADAWLLAAAAVTEDQLVAAGLDPADPELIRLTTPAGDRRWPAFQLTAGATGLVRRINRVLDAADDPWGAADWWLGQHAWLPVAPAELIGVVEDQVLVAAAEAERAER